MFMRTLLTPNLTLEKVYEHLENDNYSLKGIVAVRVEVDCNE